MQLMPETAKQQGVENIFDPAQNIQGGAKHLAYLLSLFGNDVTKSLAAYNAGENAVLRYGGVPPYDETRLYVHKALTAYYGKSSLAGGFGVPSGTTYGAAKGRPVRVTRDANNRVLLTTEPARKPSGREAL
jgi:soluble lytic murein transglycosylase-like protein